MTVKKIRCLSRVLRTVSLCAGAVLLTAGCGRKIPEMTLEEIESYRNSGNSEIISRTVSKPWHDEPMEPGTVGGSWYTCLSGDPKSFNALIAERDGTTYGIVSMMTESLFDYNRYTKKWVGRAAESWRVVSNDDGSLDVYITLRDNLYWSFYSSDRQVPVTSDDIIFWYNEIEGNEEFRSSAYSSHVMTMPDGSTAPITVHKVDDKTFYYHYPMVTAEPELFCNNDLKPSFVYKGALERGGVQGVKDLYSVASDPRTIPSCGQWFLTEYTPGQRLVFKRNPHYWEMDSKGTTLPYRSEVIAQLGTDQNTQYLLFRQGRLESFSPRPEELEEVVNNQDNAQNPYTVYNAQGSLGAPMWTFNQNPQNSSKPYYRWFTDKYFRQAMSCLLNRDRIIRQTYRGLAESKYSLFPAANKYYNPDIILQYRFSHEQARRLLEKSGFTKRSDGFLYDKEGIKVEFDISIPSGYSAYNDMAQILMDDLAAEGITLNVRQTDFQKLVEQATTTYDWQSLIIVLGGGQIWAAQGSNTWPSNGNMHIWNPLQKTPATEWEARIDDLYHAGCTTVDETAGKKIWDEFQSIILEECPFVFLVSTRSFVALRNVWDQTNYYYDNMNGSKTDYIYAAQ